VSAIGTGALSWGEARDLVISAAADPSTALGAELAGWSYPASVPQIAQVIVSAAQLGRKGSKAAGKLMPWALGAKRRETPTPKEIAKAQKEIDEEVIFT
jgi:hypothetical protein